MKLVSSRMRLRFGSGDDTANVACGFVHNSATKSNFNPFCQLQDHVERERQKARIEQESLKADCVVNIVSVCKLQLIALGRSAVWWHVMNLVFRHRGQTSRSGEGSHRGSKRTFNSTEAGSNIFDLCCGHLKTHLVHKHADPLHKFVWKPYFSFHE